MRKTIYFHMGVYRTGSTALQLFLASNDRLLAQNGFCYPRTFRCALSSHNPLARAMIHRYGTFTIPDDAAPFVNDAERLFRELREEISSFDGHVVISSEELFSLEEQAVDDLLSLFGEYDKKCVFYVRNLESIALSMTAQLVKIPHNSTHDYRLATIPEHVRSHFRYCYSPHFCNRFALWQNKIGQENAISRKYDRESFQGGSIFADFLHVLGVPMDPSSHLPEKKMNRSLTYCETVFTKDLLNRLLLETPAAVIADHLLKWEDANSGTRFCLPRDMSIEVRQSAAEIHRFLLGADILDRSFAGLLDRPSSLGEGATYQLPFSVFIDILQYLDRNIEGFGADLMQSMKSALDTAYEERLHLNELRRLVSTALDRGHVLAVWGLGEIAGKMFKKYRFLADERIQLLDKDPAKQGTMFFGKEVLSPDVIPAVALHAQWQRSLHEFWQHDV